MRDAQTRLASDLPWTANDVISLCLRTGFGIVLLLVGWVGASGEARLSHQLKWINCGVAGLVVVGVGGGLWQLAGLRRVRQRQAQLLSTARFSGSRRPRPAVVTSPVDRETRLSEVVFY